MEKLKNHPISLLEIIKAKKIVSQHLKPSPLVKYEGLSRLLGCDAYVKHENQNITGSFKIRGGINVMAQIKNAGINGVITFSTGNHGLSVATSAKLFDIPAIVVVPEGSNPVKIKLIKEAGAEVVEAGRNFDESSLIVSEISKTKGYYYVHPANEPHVVNGVGTEFLEIINDLPEVDAVILPLGGGSEVASAVTVLKAINPKIDIYAVQAELSCAAYSSWKQGEIISRPNETFAGGFATGMAYKTTFDIYKESLTDFVLLSENEILQGTALAAYHTRNLVEGAGSSTIMAAWKLRNKLAGKKVVLQFSGSNASPEELQNAYELSSFRDGKVI
ncbi:threonine/serine dehydratase [Pseudaeromonas sp. ZJS20]|uniref:threonine ammonia-lyase n=1 Tax=Pseudaeromonas aegiceratis TaxID=3153928 RepID=UPI00390C701B